MINANNAYNIDDLHNAEQMISGVISKTTGVIENNIGKVQNYILDKFSSYLHNNEEFVSEYSYEYQYDILSEQSKQIWLKNAQNVFNQPIMFIAINACNEEVYEQNVVPQIRSSCPKDIADVSINALRKNYGKILICIDYLAYFCCHQSKCKDDTELKTAFVDALFIHFLNHERRHSYQDIAFMIEGRSDIAMTAMVLYNEIPSEIDANTYGILKAVAYIKEEYNV